MIKYRIHVSGEINFGPPFLQYFFGAGSGWIIGQVSGSCTASCENVGMFCYNSDLKRHNSEVSTSPKVAELITKLGGSLKNTTCDPAYGTAADIHLQGTKPKSTTARFLLIQTHKTRPDSATVQQGKEHQRAPL